MEKDCFFTFIRSFTHGIYFKGAHVNTSGFVEATLLNALVVNNVHFNQIHSLTFQKFQTSNS
jgi:hypothetical protein